MKRTIAILVSFSLLLAACGNESGPTEPSSNPSLVAPATETTILATTEPITGPITEPTAETTTVLEELQNIRDAVESAIELEDASYFDAATAFEDAIQLLGSMAFGVNEESDVNLLQALSGVAMQLMEVHTGFMEIADNGSDQNLFAENAPSVFRYDVTPESIEGSGYKAGYSVFRENNYIRIESEAFDQESNNQLDYLRFEFSTREDMNEAMVLFVLYDIDGLLTSSNRYLLYKSGDSVQLLYSRTFGKTLEYRIDLNEWAKGTDYTWSEELLYPAN